MNIGDKIYELRTQEGLSQVQLAEKLGISQGAIGNWEAGRFEPSVFNCILLADFFGITLDELCGRSGP